MKIVQKYCGMLTTLALLAGMLAGCGKADPDPNSGLYEAVSATMMGMTIDVKEVYENGVSFDLQDGGKCVLNLDGDSYKVKWSTEGDSIHIEGGGVELDGTVGGGDLVIENMMDMGMDMTLHCDELYHEDLADGDSSSKDKDSKDEKSSAKSSTSGGVLERLRAAKNGKDVYGTGVSSGKSDDNNSQREENSGDEEVLYDDVDDESGLVNEDGSIDGSVLINPDYESVSGKEFDSGDISVMVPDGWEAFDISSDYIRVIKGGTSPDDYMRNASIQIEWHDIASGSIDSSNMEEPVEFAGLKLGDHDYHGAYGTVPGDWYSYMMMDDYEDGYILVTLSLPPDSDVYLLDSDVQAIMASIEV